MSEQKKLIKNIVFFDRSFAFPIKCMTVEFREENQPRGGLTGVMANRLLRRKDLFYDGMNWF